MASSENLPALFLAKVREQAERAEHLLALLPPDRLDWRPQGSAAVRPPATVAELLGHLLECLAGFCAVLHAFDKNRLAHFDRLRELKITQVRDVEEVRRRLRRYMDHIEEGFALLTDGDLSRPIPTVFVPQGEALLTLLLGNLEHLINHKHQLFFYLRLMGVPLATRDLYRLRGESR